MLLEMLFLSIAGFAAGLLNAVAGGGTFLSLPALLYAGLPCEPACNFDPV